MKKRIVFIISLLIMFASLQPVYALESRETTSTFNYSFIHTEEWRSLSLTDRISTAQIPTEYMVKMPTNDLLNLVLDYPFFVDILAFNSIREGFISVLSKYNGLRELITRNDLGNVVTQLYIELEVNSLIETRSDEERVWKLLILEMIIPQPEFASKYSDQQTTDILLSAESKRIAKINSGLYGGFIDILFASSREVLTLGSDISDSLIIETFVYTPEGTAIPVINTQYITNFTPSEIAIFNAQVAEDYPNVTRLSNPSKKYNCHSFAWYSATYTNHYWMNDPTGYLIDRSYTKRLGSMLTTDIAFYEDGHSAIVIGVGQSYVFVKSKWGQLGVYSHSVFDSAYIGPVTFWYRN